MACWDIGMHHLVDLDGQLLAIDAPVIDPASLLARANMPNDLEIHLVRAGAAIPIGKRQPVRLSRDEVLFFESSRCEPHRHVAMTATTAAHSIRSSCRAAEARAGRKQKKLSVLGKILKSHGEHGLLHSQ